MQTMANKCELELQNPKLAEPCQKVLQSMTRHWAGLSVFVRHSEVPMENNTAERDMRGPVVGRKNFFGSGAFVVGSTGGHAVQPVCHAQALRHQCAHVDAGVFAGLRCQWGHGTDGFEQLLALVHG